MIQEAVNESQEEALEAAQEVSAVAPKNELPHDAVQGWFDHVEGVGESQEREEHQSCANGLPAIIVDQVGTQVG